MDNQDIKKVWEQGFRNQQVNISQQEINDIMKRKSANLIEQIRRTARADQKATPFVVLAVVGVLVFLGHVDFAIFIGLLLTALYFLGGRMIKKMESVEIKDDTIKYLTDFRSLIRYMKRYYTKLIGFGMLLCAVPLFLFSIEVAGISSQEAFSAENKKFFLVFMLVMVVLFPLIGILAYHLSTKILYGKKLKRLDEMIEELSDGELH